MPAGQHPPAQAELAIDSEPQPQKSAKGATEDPPADVQITDFFPQIEQAHDNSDDDARLRLTDTGFCAFSAIVKHLSDDPAVLLRPAVTCKKLANWLTFASVELVNEHLDSPFVPESADQPPYPHPQWQLLRTEDTRDWASRSRLPTSTAPDTYVCVLWRFSALTPSHPLVLPLCPLLVPSPCVLSFASPCFFFGRALIQ